MRNRSTPPRPRAAYWLCQAGGWGAFLLVNIFASQGFLTLSWQLVSGYVFLSACGILLTHGFRSFVWRRGWIELPIARLIPRLIVANLILAVVLVALVSVYFSALPPEQNSYTGRGPMAFSAMVVVFTFNDFIILTLWSGIYFGFAHFERQRRLEIERYQAQTALAEAQLLGLRSQLNPHFLFNSLNSLRALVVEDPARAQEAITQLAAILRSHLQSSEQSLVPMASEIDTVEHYLALELIRFEDRLTIEREVDPEALPFFVPPLALQTLVENAVKYGVSRDEGAGVIRISAKVTAGQLLVSVSNTGALRGNPPTDSMGLGLSNLRTRLRLLFAERASLDLREPARGWVEASIALPATQTLEHGRT